MRLKTTTRLQTQSETSNDTLTITRRWWYVCYTHTCANPADYGTGCEPLGHSGREDTADVMQHEHISN